jgi:four helix bundle protein
MLRIYPVLLQLVADLRPCVRQLERRDPDLARQMKKSLASGPLNMAEGSYARGRNRHARYQTSVSEVREVLACLEVAGALGYLPEVTPELRSRFDHVIGTLVNVIGGH